MQPQSIPGIPWFSQPEKSGIAVGLKRRLALPLIFIFLPPYFCRIRFGPSQQFRIACCGVCASGYLAAMLSKLFAPGNDSLPTSMGLLALRLWLGVTLLLNHGVAKLKGFDSMASGFADPLKIGHTSSLALVVFAEVVASSLLAAGLITRFAALVLAVEMGVAFCFIHQRSFSGSHSGELAFIYLAGFVSLFLAGPGRISLDKKFFGGGGRGSSAKKSKSSER